MVRWQVTMVTTRPACPRRRSCARRRAWGRCSRTRRPGSSRPSLILRITRLWRRAQRWRTAPGWAKRPWGWGYATSLLRLQSIQTSKHTLGHVCKISDKSDLYNQCQCFENLFHICPNRFKSKQICSECCNRPHSVCQLTFKMVIRGQLVQSLICLQVWFKNRRARRKQQRNSSKVKSSSLCQSPAESKVLASILWDPSALLI